jgi:hypothetical protein
MRRVMDEGISDRALIDVHGIDLASLLTASEESGPRTALDRILASNNENYNGFNNYI